VIEEMKNMRVSILCASMLGLILGMTGCESNPAKIPVDATKPAPVEPPADGFVPKPASN
jgi:hypothetical protein